MSIKCDPFLPPQISITKRRSLNSCGFNDQKFKDFLLRTLSIISPCFTEDTSKARIDLLYQLFRVQSRCDQELLYLLVRKEMIKQAMGCEVFQVDSRDVTGGSDSFNEFESEGNTRSEAQQTGHSSQFSDLIGEQRYNDFADTVLRAETQRTAFSTSHDESHTRATDFGSGRAVSDTDGTRNSQSNRVTHDESTSTGNSSSDGAARGCDYRMSQQRTRGAGSVNSVFIVSAGLSRTATKHTWDHLMRNDTTSSSRATRVGRSERTLDANATSDSRSIRISSSFFNALVDELSWGRHQSQAEDHSRGQSDQVSHAEGLGQSNTESKAKSQSSTQATSSSISQFDSNRRGERSAFNITDDVKLGQRFKHLLELYKNTKELIEYKRSRLRAQGYGIGEIIFCSEDGFIPWDFADVTEQKFCCPIPKSSNLNSHLPTSFGRRPISSHA